MIFEYNSCILPKITVAGYVSYKEPWIHFRRIIDESMLYIIKNGELYIQEDDRQYILRRGDIIFLSANHMHVGFRKACCDYYYIHFKHSDIRAVEDKALSNIISSIILMRNSSLNSDNSNEYPNEVPSCLLPKYYHFANESSMGFMFNMLKDLVDEYARKFEQYRDMCSLKLSELIIRISREYVSSEFEKLQPEFPKAFIRVHEVLRYINSEYDRKLTSKDIELKFNSNFDYLNRTFHKVTGNSIFTYLNQVRINKARELIETTQSNFSDIACMVGINDPYYFSKVFKKYIGESPSQYFKNFRKKPVSRAVSHTQF